MRRSSHYHAQADHARRLADMTIQPHVQQILRRVADEFDLLADNIVAEADSSDSEMPERS